MDMCTPSQKGIVTSGETGARSMDGLTGGPHQAAPSGHRWAMSLNYLTLEGEKQEVNLHQKKGNGFWLH